MAYFKEAKYVIYVASESLYPNWPIIINMSGMYMCEVTIWASSSSFVSSLKLTTNLFNILRGCRGFSLERPLPCRLSTVICSRSSWPVIFNNNSSVNAINLKYKTWLCCAFLCLEDIKIPRKQGWLWVQIT